MNSPWRAYVAGISLLVVMAGLAVAQEGSVAAAASASKKAASSAHKVYSDDDVATLRHKNHVPDGAQAVTCDSACLDKVKDILEREAPGRWQAHLDEAMAAVKDDDSWQELYARVKAQNCTDRQTGKSPEASNPTLLTDLRSKIAEERDEMITLRHEAMALPPNSPDLEGKLNLIRVRAVKLVIMGVELTGLSSDPCSKSDKNATAAQ